MAGASVTPAASTDTGQLWSLPWSSIADVAAPALVLLAVVVPFLCFHEYDLLLPESLILVGGAAAIGMVFGAASRLRPATLVPAFMALALSLFVLSRPEVSERLITFVNRLAQLIGNAEIAFGSVLVAVLWAASLLCFLIRRHLSVIIAATFGTMVLSTLVLPIPHGGEAVESGALPGQLNDLPPVIHIILDEHIGLEGLPAELPESGSADLTIRETYRDFALYGRAYSRYAETQYSLAALMNENRPDPLAFLTTEESSYTLKQNRWFDRLKQQGYALQVYQSAWLDMCGESPAVDACYTYPLHSVNAVQRTPLSTEARLRVLLQKLFFGRIVPLLSALPSSEALDQFQKDIARAPRGVAYVVHLLLPHYGYLFREDCSLADPAEWENQPLRPDIVYSDRDWRFDYRLYLRQLICTDRRIHQLFEALKEQGQYEQATMIVHGDHGSRIGSRTILAPAESMSERDLLDHYSTLLAIKAPGVEPGIQDDPKLLQHVFAETFMDGYAEGDVSFLGEVLIRDKETDTFSPRMLVWPEAQPDETGADPNLASQGRPKRPLPELKGLFIDQSG